MVGDARLEARETPCDFRGSFLKANRSQGEFDYFGSSSLRAVSLANRAKTYGIQKVRYIGIEKGKKRMSVR